jgi:hypothetical protein
MFRSPTPATDPYVPVDLQGPHDTCLKCGRPTPVGVSLCERDNPGRIKSPSTTQVHGTIVIGVIVGFLLLLGLLRVGGAGVGPFHSTLQGYSSRADGGVQVAITVSNGGTRAAGASCRISANGAPDFRDYFFFTSLIQPGETRSFTETVPPAPNALALSPVSLAVNCN